MTITQQHVERLKQVSGPMSEQEVAIVQDMRAFLQFCLENGISSLVAFSTLSHDAGGLLRQEAGFRPKVTGYTRILDDLRAEVSNPSVPNENEADEKWD